MKIGLAKAWANQALAERVFAIADNAAGLDAMDTEQRATFDQFVASEVADEPQLAMLLRDIGLLGESTVNG